MMPNCIWNHLLFILYFINKMAARDQSDLYKTELCHKFTETGFCPYDVKCRYAHGTKELRKRRDLPAKYKTELCSSFHGSQAHGSQAHGSPVGYCPYGTRCRYIHKVEPVLPRPRLTFNEILEMKIDDLPPILELGTVRELFLSFDEWC